MLKCPLTFFVFIRNTESLQMFVVAAIRVMYENTLALVITPEGKTEQFAIIDRGVLQGDPLAPFLFIICLDYALCSTITDSDGLTLKRCRSSRHPAAVLTDLNYADDIALLEDTIKSAQDLLNHVEKACQDVSLFLSISKTKYMHLNPSTNTSLVSSDGSPFELVQDFKYLGGYTDSGYDMNTRIGQAWSALDSLNKVWKAAIKNETKLKVFKVSVETILLYGSETWTLNVARSKKPDGSYTKILCTVYNISWRDHVTNKSPYGRLPCISIVVKRQQLALAGRIFCHNEPAGKVLILYGSQATSREASHHCQDSSGE